LKIVAEQTSAIRPGTLASTYVPLNSWVYPALEQLIGRGYINTAFILWVSGRGPGCHALA
jgi:hypothetical protein